MNYERAVSLLKIIESTLPEYQPENMKERLIEALMVKVFRKLRNRVETSNNGSYNLTLNAEEAIAFHEYWTDFPIPVNLIYEATLIDGHVNEINKKYA